MMCSWGLMGCLGQLQPADLAELLDAAEPIVLATHLAVLHLSHNPLCAGPLHDALPCEPLRRCAAARSTKSVGHTLALVVVPSARRLLGSCSLKPGCGVPGGALVELLLRAGAVTGLASAVGSAEGMSAGLSATHTWHTA